MKHIKLFEQFLNEGKAGADIKPGEYIKSEYGHYYQRVDGMVGGQPAFVDVEADKKGKLKIGKRKSVIHSSTKYVKVDIEDIKASLNISEDFINEANQDNSYTFNDLQDYRKAISALNAANFYRSGNGYPPKGDEPGSYSEDERWLTIKIVRGEKEAAKVLKKSKVNYKSEYKKPMGYTVHNHGGYLD